MAPQPKPEYATEILRVLSLRYTIKYHRLSYSQLRLILIRTYAFSFSLANYLFDMICFDCLSRI